MSEISALQLASVLIFVLALVHTFSTHLFERLAHRSLRHAGLWHLLGEVEVVFGFWALVLVLCMAVLEDGRQAIEYLETRQYSEPLFVCVVMVIAASRPILASVQTLLTQMAAGLARILSPLGLSAVWLECWLGLSALPLLGSLITEPAAMTLAALLLAPRLFTPAMPERWKYAVLGTLFVNVSIGGTLTAYAAPPVLMVANTWGWDSAFMFAHFGQSAVLAVLINATAVCLLTGRFLAQSTAHQPPTPPEEGSAVSVPWPVTGIHMLFLALTVLFAHHPVIVMAILLFFLGFTQAYARYQSPLILREGLLVGFFLGGLVVLGGMQQWWLQPLVSSLPPTVLFGGALALTAITDNAALTYLGSLIEGIAPLAQYLLVAGAVGGGGLTVIANAPNPAGVALLRHGLADESVSPWQLFLAALPPTLVAATLFWLNQPG